MTKNIGEPNSEGVAEVKDAEIGSTFGVMSSRFMDAVNKLGMEDAISYFAKCGVSPLNMDRNKYRLKKKIDGLYVFEYVDPNSAPPNDAK